MPDIPLMRFIFPIFPPLSYASISTSMLLSRSMYPLESGLDGTLPPPRLEPLADPGVSDLPTEGCFPGPTSSGGMFAPEVEPVYPLALAKGGVGTRPGICCELEVETLMGTACPCRSLSSSRVCIEGSHSGLSRFTYVAGPSLWW